MRKLVKKQGFAPATLGDIFRLGNMCLKVLFQKSCNLMQRQLKIFLKF